MPPEEKKFYLTKEGLEKLNKECESLKKIKLAKTKGESPRVLESEDLNPEYLAFQEDLNFLDSRMLELDNILKNSEIIKPPPKSKQGIVGIGATVTAKVNGGVNEFTIVGTLEADPSRSRISDESPIGQCLLGKKVGMEAVVDGRPCKVMKIKYHKI